MATFEVHHANAFDWLADQPEHSFEAVLTDPPFGIVEFLPGELAKMRSGKGGVWRLPPTIGGSTRAPLPRFTTLTPKDLAHVRAYFFELGQALHRVLVPGAHVFLAGTPMLQHLVQAGMAEAGFEVRGAVMRVYRGFRGGDRPKLAEQEFPDVCVTPRGNYEPWMLFRKPISERTVADNLRKWGTGALRRISTDQPLPDVIPSGKTPVVEESVSSHPTMKPQHLLRILGRSLLPLGTGRVLEPFAGSGSSLAACMSVGYDSVGIELDQEYFSALNTNIQSLAALYPNFKGDRLDTAATDGSQPSRAPSKQTSQFDLLQ